MSVLGKTSAPATECRPTAEGHIYIHVGNATGPRSYTRARRQGRHITSGCGDVDVICNTLLGRFNYDRTVSNVRQEASNPNVNIGSLATLSGHFCHINSIGHASVSRFSWTR